MSKKNTTKTFIEKAKKVHGDKYDYDKVVYKTLQTNVLIFCTIHKEYFNQRPCSHLYGSGCPKCANNYRPTTEEFIERSKKVHGDRYTYDRTVYRTLQDKVLIFCKVHNEYFSQRAWVHLSGSGCPKCARKHKPSTEEFIKKAREVHGDKYGYDKVIYKTLQTNVQIFCKIHKEYFVQNPYIHLQGSNCPKCANVHKPTTIEFIKLAREVHGDKYNYDKVVYINREAEISIVCKIHGEFLQRPCIHLTGCGCPLCGNPPLTIETFIEKAKKIHGDKYGYDLIKFTPNGEKNSIQKVKIYCKKHGGYFEQMANSHLQGSGCYLCRDYGQDTLETFIEKAKKVHGDRYSYDKAIYINSHIKIEIFCREHGYFKQLSTTHLVGGGCPKCRASLGELSIEEYLKNKNIQYSNQQSFNDLLSDRGNPLRFDFAIFLNDKMHLLEYDGEFHFRKIYKSHDFAQTMLRDSLKNEYCAKNNIPLLRIKYTDYDNIPHILDNYISHNS